MKPSQARAPHRCRRCPRSPRRGRSGAAGTDRAAAARADHARRRPTGGARLISLDFKDADVVNLLRILAAESGRNVVIGEDVKGKMSITLRNVPWELALETVLEAKGLREARARQRHAHRQPGAARPRSARRKFKLEESKVKAETEIRTKQAEAVLKEQEALARAGRRRSRRPKSWPRAVP